LSLRRNYKVSFIAVGGICVFAASYLICFPYSIPRNTALEKSDLIAVFPGGGPGRKLAAYQLIKEGYADSLTITSGDERNANRYAEKAGLAGIIKHIYCGKARSTFEDALFAGDLAAKHGFKSLILVTGDYHLHRALFLLRSVLADQGVKIYTYGVSLEQERMSSFGTDEFATRMDGWMAPLARDGWDGGNLTQWKMIFDERVKFLGSLVEMGVYRVSGILINDYGWVRKFKKALKDLLLFGKTKSQRSEVRGRKG